MIGFDCDVLGFPGNGGLRNSEDTGPLFLRCGVDLDVCKVGRSTIGLDGGMMAILGGGDLRIGLPIKAIEHRFCSSVDSIE